MPPAAAPAAAPAVAPAEAFRFDDADVAPRTRAGKSRWWPALIVALGVAGVAAAVVVLVGPRLGELFEGGSNRQVSANGSGKDHSPNGPQKDGVEDAPVVEKNPPPADAAFPRRALLINPSNYVYANAVHFGAERGEGKASYPGSSVTVLRDQLTRRPMNMAAAQVVAVSDGYYEGLRKPRAFTPPPSPKLKGKKLLQPKTPPGTAAPKITRPVLGDDQAPPFKAVIENAITDFVESSRAQDRIIVLFAGHAVEIEKESYLVPLEGDLNDPKTLIPLKWVYDQLAGCKARQKVLILDVCRNPVARGFELPGGGEMGEQLDDLLLNPPAGVQVWSACVKGQQSVELERGSVFLQALCAALQEGLAGIQEPTNALPLELIVPKVNQRMQSILAPQKLEQVSRLTGKEPDSGAAYNAGEPLPSPLAVRLPTIPGVDVAGKAAVKSIMDEIEMIPPARETRPLPFIPPMPAKAVAAYQRDGYNSIAELQKMVAAEADKFPLRKAILDAIDVLKENSKIDIEESLTDPGGPITPAVKTAFLERQKGPALSIFALEQALVKLQKAGEEHRDNETAKRWQVHYDYTLARLKSRLIYIYEYNNILAQVRGDSLPELTPNVHNGWRVGSRAKVQVSESKVKDWVKEVSRTWNSIAEEHQGTPWAILARRERLTALGLEWRPSRD